jgi:RNA polymerase sigma factor (sigma-70 family)
MTSTLPATLSALLAAPVAARDHAWADFLEAHSRLLMFVARSFGGGHDAAMDRYATLLDELQRDDFRRLRAFAADGRSEFSTWLVVVAQRICLDERRHRYGRLRAGADTSKSAEHAARRRLVDLAGVALDAVEVEDAMAVPADELLSARNRVAALEAALAQLSPHDRLLLELRYRDDIPVADIARMVGYSSRFHAYRRIDNALERLRGLLAASGIRASYD